MNKDAARWRRYYMSHLDREQARGRANYYKNRAAILARRREKRAAEKKEKAC